MDYKELYKEHVLGKSIKQLAEENNIARITITRNWKKLGLETIIRRHGEHSFDYNFFQNIDNQTKAYILGFTHADGSVRLKGIKYQIQEQDKEILTYIKNSLKATYTVKSYPAKKVTIMGKKCQSNGYAILTLFSRETTRQLRELGFEDNKTFSIGFPHYIDDDLIRHFIRGSFDGDGGITFYTDKRYNRINGEAFICGNSIYIDELKLFFEARGYTPTARQMGKIKVLRFFKHEELKSLYDFLYEDADFALNRKKKKFEQFLNFKLDVQRS
jgi:hypothetical protein